eukprot:7386846-Ditylum_brightwellii.AAC.1
MLMVRLTALLFISELQKKGYTTTQLKQNLHYGRRGKIEPRCENYSEIQKRIFNKDVEEKTESKIRESNLRMGQKALKRFDSKKDSLNYFAKLVSHRITKKDITKYILKKHIDLVLAMTVYNIAAAKMLS